MNIEWEKEKLKRMSEFSLEEYKQLERTGLMYEFYPWATGQWLKDKEASAHKLRELIKRGF
jgi:hypothetical protein